MNDSKDTTIARTRTAVRTTNDIRVEVTIVARVKPATHDLLTITQVEKLVSEMASDLAESIADYEHT